MTRRLPILSLALAAVFVGPAPALAQSVLQVSVAAGGTVTAIAPGGSLALAAADIGQPVLATATVRYTGFGNATISGVSVSGTSEITLLQGAFPAILSPNGTTTFTIQYLPVTGNAVAAQVSIAFSDNGQGGSFPMVFTGTSPRLAFSYFFAPSGGLTDINSGERITFPATNVGSTATAVVTVLNRGTAAGALQSATLSGPAFTLSGSPAPITLQPGAQTSFSVTFSPSASGGNQGLLVLGLARNSASFSLIGTGTTPGFTATYTLPDGNVRPLTDGVAIIFPAIDINTTSTATIEIANQGTGAGTVTNVVLSSSAFRLSGLPLLPATLAAGQSLRFGIVFAPTQTGGYGGTFRIDMTGLSITGTVTASTNVPNITAAYTLSDGVARSLSDGTAITFPPVDVNGTSTATIDIVNQGPGAGTLSGVTVSGTGFRLPGMPVLPATIAAGQALRFSIAFSPTQAGSSSGAFRIDVSGRSITGTLAASTTTPTFTVAYTLADGVVRPLPDGASITLPSVDINGTSTATIDVANQGTGIGTITGISLSGAGFRLTGSPLLPATVGPGQSLRFGIVFAPTQAGSYTGSFRIDVTGRSISGTLTASTAAPTMSMAYIDPDTSNIIPLPDGGTLLFPNTPVNAASTITLLASNSGQGTGSLTSITLGSNSPAAFQLVNLPPLPLPVPPTLQARFGVRFAPQQQQTLATTLVVVLNNQTITINLQAQGVGPQFTYTYGTNARPVTSADTLAFDNTAVGQTTSLVVTVSNGGAGDGVIPVVAVSGAGFSLAEVPTVPFTLRPNAAQRFTLNFTPTQPGAVSGRLTIGGDSFTLTGTGIGSRLVFTFTSAGLTVPVTDGGVVIFPPVQVGNSQSLEFSIQNTGTSAAALSTITLAAPSAVFALQKLPGLPMNLDAGATVRFPVSFEPNNTGSLTATLRVNNSSFTLSGTGTQPAPLPAYQFQAPSASPRPAQQPAVGLTLAAPYPLALQGTLRLTFISTVFTDEPAVQFSSGGRTVNFTIPANSTKAVFNGGATTVALQTGTTAGDIVITPSFGTSAGLDLTPTAPDALVFTIPRVAPEILSASITSRTLTSFTVILSGYSTTRAIRQLDIVVTPRSGELFSTTRLTIDVTAASSAWFQSTTSQPFGGSFLVAIPFVLQNGSSTDDLVRRLQSLSITATNDAGASSPVSVTIQ